MKRTADPTYEYTRLPSGRCIRLLNLHPGPPGFRCELVPQSLDLISSFEAISYIWGDSVKSDSIMIEGCSLPITKNAYEILAKFAPKAGTRVLWIDAICINQDDDIDKSQQVRLMKEIYSSASRVIIWLGNPPEASLAHDFFSQSNSQFPGKASDEAHVSSTTINDKDLGQLEFRKLLQHPYWTRVWVVQEIVVARAAHVYYGDKFWGWRQFARIVRALLTEEKRALLRKMSQLEGLRVSHFVGVEKISTIDEIRRRYRKQHHDDLPRILINFCDSCATVERDRVYAFLGISSAATDNTLMADYTKSDRQIFEDVACHSLRTELPFLYFSFAGVANGIKADTWPSWVPDLKKAPEIRLPFPLWDFGKYTASADAKPHIRILEESHQIAVNGVIVDEIAVVTDMKSVIEPDEAAQLRQHGRFMTKPAMLAFCQRELQRHEEAWEIAKQRTQKTYTLNGQPRNEAFWRTLLCDMSSNPIPSEFCSNDDYKEWGQLVNTLLQGLEMRKGRPTDYRSEDQPNLLQDGTDIPFLDLPDLTCFPLRLSLSSFRRQFAVTKQGYMALAVPGIRAGDIICVFSGAETPHALRKDNGAPDGKYRLIGDIYVHGWMDGTYACTTLNISTFAHQF
ncbi:heterokaryon incompatibility protein-domain-containing protein [Bisporella sp. PMI_857]|nr:heterokaryon incompatibility protein-domain-containing protein [Bisporella sp. PMI_857]